MTALRSPMHDASFSKARAGCPDLLVAFDADPRACGDGNAYIIAEQRKPPDFVVEIASAATGGNDTDHKRLGTPGWGSRNTGGSTRRATTTAPGWSTTGWWRAGTSPLPLRSLKTASCKDTVRS